MILFFIYQLIVYIVLDYDYCVLYFATRKWPLALCCLINEMKGRVTKHSTRVMGTGSWTEFNLPVWSLTM